LKEWAINEFYRGWIKRGENMPRGKELDYNKIKEMLISGMSSAEIAKEEHCSKSSIERLRREFREADLLPDLAPIGTETTIDEGKVWALAWGRWSIDRIADECRCTTSEVLRILRERLHGQGQV
jgi:transposase